MLLASHTVPEILHKDIKMLSKSGIVVCESCFSPQWQGAQRVFLNVKDTRTPLGRTTMPDPTSSLTRESSSMLLLSCLSSDWTPTSDISTASLLRAGILKQARRHVADLTSYCTYTSCMHKQDQHRHVPMGPNVSRLSLHHKQTSWWEK